MESSRKGGITPDFIGGLQNFLESSRKGGHKWKPLDEIGGLQTNLDICFLTTHKLNLCLQFRILSKEIVHTLERRKRR